MNLGILNDRQITKLAQEQDMISPFTHEQVRRRDTSRLGPIPFAPVISYGVSSFGYDARVDRQFKVFTNVYGAVVDPKNFDSRSFVDIEADQILIPPNSFALARTVERFKIPDNIMVVCLGKSTYARCGIIVNVTPLEPGWEGHVTLEFSNTTPLPAKVYAGEGAAQFLFFSGERPDVTYSDRNGKYQGQVEVTPPRA